MKTAVIISGGDIDTDFALAFLKKTNYEVLIGADKGIRFLRQVSIWPTHIVGDFDSAAEEELACFEQHKEITIQKFQPEKDFTDTHIAVELAMELECDCIHILGGMGKRIDHLLANIRVLAIPAKKGICCYLTDAHNRIWVTDHSVRLKRSEIFGKYLSLFALGGQVEGLTVKGCKYPLEEYNMDGEDPLGVSNEVLEENASVFFRKGLLVIAESAD